MKNRFFFRVCGLTLVGPGFALCLAWLSVGLQAQSGSLGAPASVLSGRTNQGAPGASVSAVSWDDITAYQEQRLEGWRVLVNQKLLADEPLCTPTLALLDRQLRQITRAVPERPLAQLRQVPIWVEHSSSQFPCMCYHESRDWLQSHGVNPAKTGAVELANPTTFLVWTREQPWMVLHELAHGYHQRFLGENHEGIQRCYERAKAARLYESVLRNNGRHEPHYALRNPKEYFAEMTEAFFGTNDFYPFVRAELMEHDRQMFDLLCDLLCVTNALDHSERNPVEMAGAPVVPTADSAPTNHSFRIGTTDFLLDGRRLQIRCGEIHAPRVPKEYWRHRLQMAKAMGLNTVCAYLFWNLHEPRPGEYAWTGQADAAEFCRIAQEEGLWVILRPGPYSCAEWEMGGTPWWLLKENSVRLRSRDPGYLGPAKRYLNEVGRVLAPLQITRGGPIIMTQVENEYGFFGKDPQYMDEIRKALLDAGFDVPLFECNPTDVMSNGLLTNLFQAANFGADPNKNFAKLRKLQPTGPLLCSEFYPGWFDTWGQPHHLGKPESYLPNLKLMLDMGASFSIYMAHGGTTFGLWSGCDRPFKPDTSSYDYDAPISEAGWTTIKFFLTRELFAKYLLPGEQIPEPPAQYPVVTFAPIELNESAPLFDHLPQAINDETPRTMETYDQGYGCILYRTTIPMGPPAQLVVAAIHDFGYVFLDGKRVGVLDRRSASAKIGLPERARESRLDILVEPMGRINFGPEMADCKGLIAPVSLNKATLKGWEVYKLPLGDHTPAGLRFTRSQPNLPGPAFWRGTFSLPKVGDTFLDLHHWGKGDLWVNGHCLGRFWNIGPTQTAYAPGCWLRPGTNEVVILDLLGPERPQIAGLEKPVLDELHPEKDFAQSRRPTVKLNLVAPIHSGTFAAGADTQTIRFTTPATGEFFCLESINAHDGKPYAAVAEMELLDSSGSPISHNGWTIAYVDSEERVGEDGSAENAIDGQTEDFWHTEWKSTSPDHPHRLILNLGKTQTISGFIYVPRPGGGGGRIKDYRIYVGNELVQ